MLHLILNHIELSKSRSCKVQGAWTQMMHCNVISEVFLWMPIKTHWGSEVVGYNRRHSPLHQKVKVV